MHLMDNKYEMQANTGFGELIITGQMYGNVFRNCKIQEQYSIVLM